MIKEFSVDKELFRTFCKKFQTMSLEELTGNIAIGILLCTQKIDTLVRMTLPEDNKTILASEYKLYLPTSEQLVKEVDMVKKLAKGKKKKK